MLEMYPAHCSFSFNANALGSPDDLISPHECWIALGETDCKRRLAYLSLFEQTLGQQRIEDINYGVRKGLPTGSSKFKQQ